MSLETQPGSVLEQARSLVNEDPESNLPGEAPGEEDNHNLASYEEETDKTEGLEEEREEETDELEEAAAEGDDGGDDDAEITTLTEFANAAEVEPSVMYGLKIPMPNGDPVDIGTLKNYYMEGKVSSEEREAFAAERKTFQDTMEQQKQQTMSQLQQLQQIPEEVRRSEARLRSLQDTYQNTDWNDLQQRDPGDAAWQRQRLNDEYQQEVARYNQAKYQVQAAIQNDQNERKTAVAGQMMSDHPEWKDPELAKKAGAAMAGYVAQFGLDPEHLNTIGDARVLNMIYDAATNSGTIKKSKTAVKTLKKSSIGALKRGGVSEKANRKSISRKRVVDRAKTTRNKGDILTAARLLTGVRK